MEIILARHAGFCFGVKRATQIAFEAARKPSSAGTYTLGPIIHSPQVVKRLEDLGVKVLQDLSSLDAGTVIIRSHGVTEAELAEAEEKRLDVVDATCPFVKKAQGYVKKLSSEGYEVIVLGDYDHPEVQGIISYASGKVHVVAAGEDVIALPMLKRIGIVAQTTQSLEHLQDVVTAALTKGTEVRVYNTICDATSVRQDEARSLAATVGCMVVIGGYNSANTKRLAEVCLEIQPNTYHVESSEQLDGEWFHGVERVGVTAGASTPKWLIDGVIERIAELSEDKKD
ncbi:MAG TPA: 4-hydroxy-3-methylbut-2-enyl diphosphate reductase [Geobacteraceae bacterium]|nr:4-hydroxy-3-methylbut-2-enyl diphosphate reductase [Geobacteraceae bacterium]